MTDAATVSVSISRKVNLGNYESVDIFFSLNGLDGSESREEMETLLQHGEDGYVVIRDHMIAKVEALHKARG